MKLGIEKTAMIRLRAGISCALTEAMDEGHCGLPTDQLIPLAEELLEAPKELTLTALELERSEGAVIADRAWSARSLAEEPIGRRASRAPRNRCAPCQTALGRRSPPGGSVGLPQPYIGGSTPFVPTTTKPVAREPSSPR